MLKFILPILLMATPALAAEATVTLTQQELQDLIAAENAKAVGNYMAAEAAQKAKPVYDKVKSAFTPAPASAKEEK